MVQAPGATPGTALGNGNHALTVTATDAAGNVSPTSAGFNIVVDTVAPLAPTIIQAFDDVVPGTGTLSNGAYTNDTRPVLNGSAEAGARVAIYDNGTLLATVTAAVDGTGNICLPHWATASMSLPPLPRMPPGTSAPPQANLLSTLTRSRRQRRS